MNLIKKISYNNELESTKEKKDFIDLLNNAINEGFSTINPEHLVQSYLTVINNTLVIEDNIYDLNNFDNIFVLGAGKSTYLMCKGISKLIPVVKGIINIPNSKDFDKTIPNFEIYQTGHPFPDERTINATHKQIRLLRDSTEKDLVIVAISGGASALFEVPVDGISFDDLVKTYKILVNSGLDIIKVNAIRKHLSIVKGGKFFSYTKATIIGLYISDVPSNELTLIGSGPTIADSSTFTDCFQILNTYGLFYELPVSIQETVVRGHLKEIEDTPKITPSNVSNFLVGSNKLLLDKISNELTKSGLSSVICASEFSGEAKIIGEFLEEYVSFPYIGFPICLIWGGESTVSIGKSKYSKGGRNQELILSFLYKIIENSNKNNVLLLSVGTDGIDGNSSNMGAFVITEDIHNLNLDLNILKKGIVNHSSAEVIPPQFIISSGSTNTNVGDLLVLAIY